jgi:ATP-dependent RNA helicase SUPV3L1/SUV3
MATTAGPLLNAGLFPTNDVIQRFCACFPPGTPYSYVLLRLVDLAKVNPRFEFKGYENVILLADLVQPIKNLSTIDRMSICFAPVSLRDPNSIELIKAMATCVAEQRPVGLLELENLDLDILDEEIIPSREHLKKLESLHKGLVLYCWMSFRSPGVFIQRGLATHAKSLVEASIDACLSKLPIDLLKESLQQDRRLKDIKQALPMEDDADEDQHVEFDAEHAEEGNSKVAEMADSIVDSNRSGLQDVDLSKTTTELRS